MFLKHDLFFIFKLTFDDPATKRSRWHCASNFNHSKHRKPSSQLHQSLKRRDRLNKITEYLYCTKIQIYKEFTCKIREENCFFINTNKSAIHWLWCDVFVLHVISDERGRRIEPEYLSMSSYRLPITFLTDARYFTKCLIGQHWTNLEI